MMYEIKRFSHYPDWVGVRFESDVPVEVREALIKAGFSWNDDHGCWFGIGFEESFIDTAISSAVKNAKPRPVMSKADEAALRAEYMERIMNGEGENWRKYYEGRIGVLVRLENVP